MIDKTNIKDEVMSHTCIYSVMYASNAMSYVWNGNRRDWKYPPYKDSEIVDIDVRKLEWSNDDGSFWFVWGGPGPDYNWYTPETYGNEWAFTKEELTTVKGAKDTYFGIDTETQTNDLHV